MPEFYFKIPKFHTLALLEPLKMLAFRISGAIQIPFFRLILEVPLLQCPFFAARALLPGLSYLRASSCLARQLHRHPTAASLHPSWLAQPIGG